MQLSGKGWITKDGQYMPAGMNHWETVNDSPSSFGLKGDERAGDVKIDVFNNGNIRVDNHREGLNVEFWEPTEDAYRRLRKLIQSNSGEIKTIYVDVGDGERHQISPEAFLRFRSPSSLVNNLNNPTDICQFIGDKTKKEMRNDIRDKIYDVYKEELSDDEFDRMMSRKRKEHELGISGIRSRIYEKLPDNKKSEYLDAVQSISDIHDAVSDVMRNISRDGSDDESYEKYYHELHRALDQKFPGNITLKQVAKTVGDKSRTLKGWGRFPTKTGMDIREYFTAVIARSRGIKNPDDPDQWI